MTSKPQRKIFIPMKPDNVRKIIERTKWTTLRTFPDADKIGLEVGESAITMFGDQEFVITNLGPKTVEEAGGKEAIWASEGFDTVIGFAHVERWIEGYQRLYLYTIYGVSEWNSVKQTVLSMVARQQSLA